MVLRSFKEFKTFAVKGDAVDMAARIIRKREEVEGP